MVLNADESGDLDEVERGDFLLEHKWTSGSLYDDSSDTFRLESEDDEEEAAGNFLLFLLSIDGGLHVCIGLYHKLVSIRLYLTDVVVDLPAPKLKNASVCRGRSELPTTIPFL